MSEPHKATDQLFDELIGDAKSPDAKLLLSALQHVCYTLEVLTLTVQSGDAESDKTLTHVLDKLGSIKSVVQDESLALGAKLDAIRR